MRPYLFVECHTSPRFPRAIHGEGTFRSMTMGMMNFVQLQSMTVMFETIVMSPRGVPNALIIAGFLPVPTQNYHGMQTLVGTHTLTIGTWLIFGLKVQFASILAAVDVSLFCLGSKYRGGTPSTGVRLRERLRLPNFFLLRCLASTRAAKPWISMSPSKRTFGSYHTLHSNMRAATSAAHSHR